MIILFVCTGNTCRSPMAEGIFNSLAARENLAAQAFSCGISAMSVPASRHAETIAAEYRADISSHMARQISRKILAEADRVYCVSQRHAMAVTNAFPEFSDRVTTLAKSDISDPFGGSLEDYKAVGAQVFDAVSEIVGKIKRGEAL